MWCNPQNSFLRSKVYFKRWLAGSTIHDLAGRKHVSDRTMRRLVRTWLRLQGEGRQVNITSKYLVIDGTFLERRHEPVLIVLDADTHRPIFWRYGVRLGMHDLPLLFFAMKERGCMPHAATVDGNPALSKALLLVWPWIRIQRCVVHVQRQGLMWCRRKPKRSDARHLRKLFVGLTNIASRSDVSAFLECWNQWEVRYEKRLSQ